LVGGRGRESLSGRRGEKVGNIRSGILHSSKLENPMHVASFLNRGKAGGAEREREREGGREWKEWGP
jgi:hypothetical protein